MTAYTDLSHAAPSAGTVTTSITSLPSAARLRDIDGADVGDAGGSAPGNDWTLQPLAGNGNYSEILAYALQEASRLVPTLGEFSIRMLNGQYYCHNEIQVGDAEGILMGQGPNTCINAGTSAGLNMTLLSTTPKAGASLSEAAIFSPHQIPSLLRTYVKDRKTNLQLKHLKFCSDTSFDNRTGSLGAGVPDYDNLNIQAFVLSSGQLFDTPPAKQSPLTVFDVKINNLSVMSCRFQGKQSPTGVSFTNVPAPSVVNAILVTGALGYLPDGDPDSAGGQAWASPGNTVYIMEHQRAIPISGDLDIRNCTFVDIGFNVAGTIAAYKKPAVSPERLNWSGGSASTTSTINNCDFTRAGADAFGSWLSTFIEHGDQDFTLTNNRADDCGSIFGGIHGFGSWLQEAGTMGLTITNNAWNNTKSAVGLGWPFGLLFVSPDPSTSVSAGRISYNKLLDSTGTLPVGILVDGMKDTDIKHNKIVAWDVPILIFNSYNVNTTVSDSNQNESNQLVAAGKFHVQLNTDVHDCACESTQQNGLVVLDLGNQNSTKSSILLTDPTKKNAGDLARRNKVKQGKTRGL